MTDLHENPVIGVLGGSGVYDMDGLVDAEWRDVGSSFGPVRRDSVWYPGRRPHGLSAAPRPGHKYSPSQSTIAPISTP